MKEPQKFPRALTGVMITVAVLFASFGVLGYAAYGSDVQTVVLVNLPQEEKFVQASQFLCTLQLVDNLLTFRLDRHLALHSPPALPCCAHHGDWHLLAQWQEQPPCQVAKEHFPCLHRYLLLAHLVGRVLRTGQVRLPHWCIRLVSRTITFHTPIRYCSPLCISIPPLTHNSIPLCFIYPPMLHLKACARTKKAKILDSMLLAFGIIVGLYTTLQTIRSLFAPGGGDSPKFGNCEVPNGS